MAETSISYVEQTEAGSWRLAGSRVSLDSVIHLHHDGLVPNEIVLQFPSLSIEQVHGAIAFYLHNQEEIDEYFKQQQDRCEQLAKEAEANPSPLRQRLREQQAGRLRTAGE
jgi:uncharacterized protein (DUF433 family)